MTPRTLRLKSPDDLLAFVPTVLGFHPEESLVLLTVGSATEPFFARVDLPGRAGDVDTVIDELVGVAQRQRVASVALVAYCHDADSADRVLPGLVEALEGLAVSVPIAMRADGVRWFRSHDDPGTPYDVSTHPLTLQAVVDGRLVHRSRDALRDSLLPTDPDEVERVQREVDRALDRFTRGALRARGVGREAARGTLVAEGRWLQQRVRGFVQERCRLSDAEVGRALVALVAIEVRDVVWAEIAREDAHVHVDLWRDVVRRSPLETLAPPAALLGFAAWLAGDGALAWCAVDRSREAQPDYSMAGLVAQALAGAVPPSSWEPLPPEALGLFAG